jgi:C-terminal processing protease CtpA/Prc
MYGALSESIYVKNRNEKDYVNLPKNVPAFQFNQIDNSTQYLQIKHFSANPKQMALSESFHERIKDSLTAPNLIVDLRNNDGGAEKVSKKFLTLLKDYSRRGNIYILINYNTQSQGEIFTLELKELANVKVLGQTTMGKITYGSNYGTRQRLPSNKFEVYITDMKGTGKGLLAYESIGIKPDIEFHNQSDWIGQVLGVIGGK